MSFTHRYFDQVKNLLDQIPEEGIIAFTDLLTDAWKEGKKVILMGNGGSSANASHIVNDLQKCLQYDSGKPLKAMCLSDNTALILAWGNDTKFDNIYAPQVECWAESGDLVIGISGSGNSMNVINAIEKGNEVGALTLGLAGFDGGKLAKIAKITIVVPSDNMQQIEDLHMIILHLVFSELRRRATSL